MPSLEPTPAPITDEEWIAASQACCGHDPDDDPPPEPECTVPAEA